MSFFFGGNDNAVPVLVKHMDRLFLGGRLSEVDDDDDDDDGVVGVGAAGCGWCRLDPVTTATSS